jgi:tetraacyldisaccharide 4'-kinase
MQIVDDRGFLPRWLAEPPRGRTAKAIRAATGPAAWVYERLMRRRREAYRDGRRESVALGVPVISVGNLTVGGTGKTPMVEWIVRWCLQNGRHPAILSRGYGARPTPTSQPRNDEAILLRLNLPQVPHYANPDRVAAGRLAVEAGADCLILDDGFQHLRVRRDLNLALIDALDPFGGGRVLPSGRLREPLSCLSAADAVVLTRTEAVGKIGLQNLRQRVRALFPEKPILDAVHRPVRLTMPDGSKAEELSWLDGKSVFLFCGLGNPQGFVHTVEKLGADIVVARFLPDHYPYGRRAVTRLAEDCLRVHADSAVTTEKDAVKIGPSWPGMIPLRVVRIEMDFSSGLDQMRKLLKDAVSR